MWSGGVIDSQHAWSTRCVAGSRVGEGKRELFGGAQGVCRGWSRQIGIQKAREEMGYLEQREA